MSFKVQLFANLLVLRSDIPTSSFNRKILFSTKPFYGEQTRHRIRVIERLPKL